MMGDRDEHCYEIDHSGANENENVGLGNVYTRIYMLRLIPKAPRYQ